MTIRSSRNLLSAARAARRPGEAPGAEIAAEDAFLRAFARILREADEADRAARPALRLVSGGRRRPPSRSQ